MTYDIVQYLRKILHIYTHDTAYGFKWPKNIYTFLQLNEHSGMQLCQAPMRGGWGGYGKFGGFGFNYEQGDGFGYQGY